MVYMLNRHFSYCHLRSESSVISRHSIGAHICNVRSSSHRTRSRDGPRRNRSSFPAHPVRRPSLRTFERRRLRWGNRRCRSHADYPASRKSWALLVLTFTEIVSVVAVDMVCVTFLCGGGYFLLLLVGLG